MPAAYSKDLREKVVAAYDAGEGTEPEIARRFCVGEASVRRWRALKRVTGTVAAKVPSAVRPDRRLLDSEGEAQLAALVRATPDASADELADAMKEKHEVTVSRSTVNRALRRMKLTRKKRRS